ncbi:hypothetical protein HYT74_01050 [Candidatus Daviesbacteria bacterium]|nr:hypothetical protein [Candidatus Daviesbacteria bacterium]
MTKNIRAFFLCSVVVFVTQFILLQPVLQYRLFNYTEDWPFIVLYRFLDLNFLDKLIYVWKTAGLHTSAQVFHIGILSDMFRFDYSSYQIANVALKAVGTLSFFPLILVLFKSRKLAFLATILFGISSATAGSFLWVVKGSEYIGIALMNIFFVTYYKKLLYVSSALFLAAYLMAPPRMFPLLLLVPLVEIYWLFSTGKLRSLKFSIVRVIILILPVILISLPAPVSSCCPFTSRPPVLFKEIINGNWHNLLDPFAGIGWTLLTNDYWQFFGKLEIETFTNFTSYLAFLLKGPILIFGILTLILSPILSKKPIKFFISVFGINLFLDILMFFIANDNYRIFENILKTDNIGHFIITKYPTIVGIYILIVAFVTFLEWRKNQENKLLQAVWVGPIFSVIFLWSTWIIMGPLINDYFSVHWYFGIPAMGTTLFLAAILSLFYEKLEKRKLFRIFAAGVIFLIIIIFYYTHGRAIEKQYLGINPDKITLQDQQTLQEKLMSKLGPHASIGDLLVYLDIAEDTVNLRRTKQYYREALVVRRFGYWVHFRRTGNGTINNGCIEAVTDRETLQSRFVLKDGKKGFIYTGYCTGQSGLYTEDNVFYGLDNFYAFRIQGGEFIDIKQEIIKEPAVFPELGM